MTQDYEDAHRRAKAAQKKFADVDAAGERFLKTLGTPPSPAHSLRKLLDRYWGSVARDEIVPACEKIISVLKENGIDEKHPLVFNDADSSVFFVATRCKQASFCAYDTEPRLSLRSGRTSRTPYSQDLARMETLTLLSCKGNLRLAQTRAGKGRLDLGTARRHGLMPATAQLELL
ncbi:MAG: hypothetical protein PHE27_07945 [Alphaproteobacteria bacterium]|nr:hypothetical protein [Alphaproteobacteria bacterium]